MSKYKCPLCRGDTCETDELCYCPDCIEEEKRDVKIRDGAYMQRKTNEALREKHARYYFGFSALSDPPKKDETTLPFLFSKNKKNFAIANVQGEKGQTFFDVDLSDFLSNQGRHAASDPSASRRPGDEFSFDDNSRHEKVPRRHKVDHGSPVRGREEESNRQRKDDDLRGKRSNEPNNKHQHNRKHRDTGEKNAKREGKGSQHLKENKDRKKALDTKGRKDKKANANRADHKGRSRSGKSHKKQIHERKNVNKYGSNETDSDFSSCSLSSTSYSSSYSSAQNEGRNGKYKGNKYKRNDDRERARREARSSSTSSTDSSLSSSVSTTFSSSSSCSTSSSSSLLVQKRSHENGHRDRHTRDKERNSKKRLKDRKHDRESTNSSSNGSSGDSSKQPYVRRRRRSNKNKSDQEFLEHLLTQENLAKVSPVSDGVALPSIPESQPSAPLYHIFPLDGNVEEINKNFWKNKLLLGRDASDPNSPPLIAIPVDSKDQSPGSSKYRNFYQRKDFEIDSSQGLSGGASSASYNNKKKNKVDKVDRNGGKSDINKSFDANLSDVNDRNKSTQTNDTYDKSCQTAFGDDEDSLDKERSRRDTLEGGNSGASMFAKIQALLKEEEIARKNIMDSEEVHFEALILNSIEARERSLSEENKRKMAEEARRQEQEEKRKADERLAEENRQKARKLLEEEERSKKRFEALLRNLAQEEERQRTDLVWEQKEERAILDMEQERNGKRIREENNKRALEMISDEESNERVALEEEEEEAWLSLLSQLEEELACARDAEEEAQNVQRSAQFEADIDKLLREEASLRNAIENQEKKDREHLINVSEDALADVLEAEEAAREAQELELQLMEMMKKLIKEEEVDRDSIETDEDIKRGGLEARRRFILAAQQLAREEAEERDELEICMEEELVGVIEFLEDDYYRSKRQEEERIQAEKEAAEREAAEEAARQRKMAEEEKRSRSSSHKFRTKSESLGGNRFSRLIPGQEVAETEDGKLKLIGDPAIAAMEERMRERKRQEKIRQKKLEDQVLKQIEDMEAKQQKYSELKKENDNISNNKVRKPSPPAVKNSLKRASPIPKQSPGLSHNSVSSHPSLSEASNNTSGDPFAKFSAFDSPDDNSLSGATGKSAENRGKNNNNNNNNKKKSKLTNNPYGSPVPASRTPRLRKSTFADDVSSGLSPDINGLDFAVAGKKIGTPTRSRSRASSLASIGVPTAGGGMHFNPDAVDTPKSRRVSQAMDINVQNLHLETDDDDEL